MSFEDTHGVTSRGIRWPMWLAKVARKGAPEESLRLDLETIAKDTDRELVKVQTAVDLKVNDNDPRIPYVLIGDPEFFFLVHDVNYVATDIALRQDGQFHDFVVQRLAKRIGAELGALGGGGLTSDRYLVDGVLVPVNTDLGNLTIWGSSSAQFVASFLTSTMAPHGATVFGQGKSAERIQHTAARQGSIPALLTVAGGSIPASGPVTVTASNMITSSALKPFTGTLAGVHGTLSSSPTVMTFTRTTSGGATPVPAGTAFISEFGSLHRDDTTHLWVGKNNWSDSGAINLVVSGTKTMFEFTRPLVKRSLIWGQFVDSEQVVGSVQYNFVVAVNAALKAFFGDLFFDVRAYLASPQLWVDAGVSPTGADLTAQSNGIKPPSVSQDTGHLNDAGNQAISTAALRHMREVLGWY